MNAFDHINLLVKIAQAAPATPRAQKPAKPAAPNYKQQTKALKKQYGGTDLASGSRGFYTKNGVPVYVGPAPIQMKHYPTIQKDVTASPGNSFRTHGGGEVTFHMPNRRNAFPINRPGTQNVQTFLGGTEASPHVEPANPGQMGPGMWTNQRNTVHWYKPSKYYRNNMSELQILSDRMKNKDNTVATGETVADFKARRKGWLQARKARAKSRAASGYDQTDPHAEFMV